MSDGDACDMFFRCARHSVSAHSQETFCHLSRNSVSMIFCQTHWCCSVWVAWLSRRRVRYVVHACARVERCGRTFQLLVSGSRHACRTIPCVCDASHQRLLDRTWRAAQSHRNRVSRVLSGNGVHIHRSTFLSRAGARKLRRGAGSAYGQCFEWD